MIARTSLSLVMTAAMLSLLAATSGETPVAPPMDAVGPLVVVAHCDAVPQGSTCVEYGARAEAEAECSSLVGVVADGGCPAENRTGACEYQGQLRRYYSSGGAPTDAAFAQRHCENALAGKFVP
jgi:hypothetical protein